MSTRQYGAMQAVNKFMRDHVNIVLSLAEVAKETGYSRAQVNQVLVRMADRPDYNTHRVSAGMYVMRSGATATPNQVKAIHDAIEDEKPKERDYNNSGGRVIPTVDPVSPFLSDVDEYDKRSMPMDVVSPYPPMMQVAAKTQEAITEILEANPTYEFVGYAGGTPIVRSEYNNLYAVIPLEDVIGD